MRTHREYPESEECTRMTLDNERAVFAAQRSAWVCDLGNGEWDHDWEEKEETSGEVDGGPGDRWRWRECRVCGARDDENPKQNS